MVLINWQPCKDPREATTPQKWCTIVGNNLDFSLSFRVPLSCQCNLGNDWFTIYWHSNWPVFHIWREITDKINQSRPTHKTGRKCQSRYSGQKLARKPPQILLMWMNCQDMVSVKDYEVIQLIMEIPVNFYVFVFFSFNKVALCSTS